MSQPSRRDSCASAIPTLAYVLDDIRQVDNRPLELKPTTLNDDDTLVIIVDWSLSLN